MASDGSSSTDARPTRLPSEERRGAAYARAVEPDRGIPAHVGGEKQLHSATGYNLVIDSKGSIYGTREPYNQEAVMELSSRAAGEVQIKGKSSKFYLAMNEKGKIYAERDQNSENTWFRELYNEGWNNYLWLGNNKDWYLGIKKSGKMKRGHRTEKTQNAVKFVPRPASPSYN
ncbi:fibroblast growth factor 1-like [Stegodyphus dumicola]|uniref:fibroblast growth factor 1-like n=1 Tax=Stegodyphus dumicola TaxID=202533 RepID=UPI0015B23D76|nr:fibroblast growth factor 1-like [Stegodyphus dumicola]